MEIPLYSQGGTYSARLDRQMLANLLSEGILGSGSFAVTQRGAGANFSVDVAAGACVVEGDDQANQGNYLCVSTATENVVVSAAPGSNSRYDLVVVQVNDPTAGGTAGDDFTIEVVAGTPSATPSPPAVPDSALAIAVIGPIATATASITDSIIETGDTNIARLAHEVVDAAAIGALQVGSAELASDAVTTAKILDANVTEAKLATAVLSSSWTTITASGSWSGSVLYKKIGNVVMIQMRALTWAAGSGSTAATTIGTLASGFRPTTTIVIPGAEGGGSTDAHTFQITSAGVITKLGSAVTGEIFHATGVFDAA